MPDGDIFSKSVPRPWVRTSRLAFGKQDFESAAATAVKVVAHELGEIDGMVLGEAIQAISQPINAAHEIPDRRTLVRNLGELKGALPETYVEALQRVAQRNLFGGAFPIKLSTPRGIWEEPAIRTGVEFLSELTIMNIAPAKRAARLAEAGKMDAAGFDHRAETFRTYLQVDPGIHVLASSLIRTPVSLSQRQGVPRVKRTRLSQRELLDEAIG